MFARQAVSKADMDKATAALKQARAAEQAVEAALQQALQQLEYTRVKAPYNGIVTERHIEVGETAQPGQPLMSGLSLDSMRISVDVPQNLVELIRTERKAQARIGGKWITVDDVTVFPVADPRSDTFEVRLQLPPGIEGVFPGMYIQVGFVAGSQQAWWYRSLRWCCAPRWSACMWSTARAGCISARSVSVLRPGRSMSASCPVWMRANWWPSTRSPPGYC